MAFKMRNSVIKGSRIHKDKIKVQREGYANLADGRVPSSAFQSINYEEGKIDPYHVSKSTYPKHKVPYLKHALYESLTEEEKKEYDSLNKTERSNVDKNTELHQLKNALGDKVEGVKDNTKILPGQSIPFKHTPYPGSRVEAVEDNNRHYAFAHEGGKAKAEHKDNIVDAGSEVKAKQAVEKAVEEDKQK